MVFYVYADLCSLLAATGQFSILIGQNMQLTGCHNGNEMRHAQTPKFQLSGPTVHSLYCGYDRVEVENWLKAKMSQNTFWNANQGLFI